MHECIRGLKERLNSTFDRILVEELDNGEPAEYGKTEREFAKDFLIIENLMEEAIEEVGKEALRKCRLSQSDAMDILEGHWSRKVEKGDYDKLSDEREPF